EITNTYDSCTDGRGRICTASSTASKITYGYNPLGLQSTTTSVLNGTSTSFTTGYSYDRQGNQTSITYPDNSQIQYNYDAAGLLNGVNSSTSTNITIASYSPMGQKASVLFSNGITTTYTYDPAQLYRLTRILTTGSTTITTSSTTSSP